MHAFKLASTRTLDGLSAGHTQGLLKRLQRLTAQSARWGAGLLFCASAAAQVVTAPLACERATVTVFAGCTGTDPLKCPPGGGPGMLQKIAAQPASGVTGGALAGGYAPNPAGGFSREVFYSYTVPDVRVFAPDMAKTLLTPVSVQTWVIKNSSVPGRVASSLSVDLLGGQVATGKTGQTDLSGSNTYGPWLLVGQVMAKAYMKGYLQYVQYGFSCSLPVANMVLVAQ